MNPVRSAMLTLTAVITLAATSPTSAADRIGDCELSGPKGVYAIIPAKPGRLTVEAHLPAPAWWNGDVPDRIAGGFEYCLAANIAYRLGLDRVEVVNVAWPGTEPRASFWQAILGGQDLPFDLALAQISITPERAKLVAFSVPYYHSNIGMMAKASKGLSLDAVGDLRIGVHAGTTGEAFVEQTLRPKRPATRFGDTPSMFMALQSGRIDVAMTDTTILLSQAAASTGRFKVVGQFATNETYSAIYPKASPNRATLDNVIQALIDDGTVAALTETWLSAVWGQDAAKIPFLRP
jgi:polar amino acid transport system substrate-binding protein